MILPDWAWGALGPWMVTPYQPSHVNPHSYDLRLGDRVLLQRYRGIEYPNTEAWLIGTGELDFHDPWKNGESVASDLPFLPGDSVLATTEEYVRVPRWLRMQGMLKSSAAREGLNHRTALYIDAGFTGQITLELEFARTGRLVPFERLLQVEAQTVLPFRAYHQRKSSNYHRQQGPTENRAKRLAFRAGAEGDLVTSNKHLNPSFRLPVKVSKTLPVSFTKEPSS